MSADPVLSVVTPAMNSARFIAETLDSVAAIAHPHEHIVIDGGSSDATVEILRDRRDPDLIWSSEPDRGQTHAVNKGLARARGRFIAWLNADDAFVAANVEAAVAYLTEHPGVSAVYGFLDVIDAQGTFQRRYRCGPFSWQRYLYAGDYVPTPTIIFRSSLLAQAPELDERYRDAADYDFYLRLLRDAKVRRIREPLVRFRYHADSKTGSNVALQESEALDVRLGYARGFADRVAMLAIRRLKQVRERLTSSWPEGER